MVTNPSVTGVTNLTTQQATDIWTGKTTNWKDVGGPDQPIVLIIRPASSGTRATFKRIVLGGATEASGQALTEDSNGAVATAVTNTPGSTSYIGFAYYQSNKSGLTALQLDGVDATLANMGNGTYKLQSIGHMYTKGNAQRPYRRVHRLHAEPGRPGCPGTEPRLRPDRHRPHGHTAGLGTCAGGIGRCERIGSSLTDLVRRRRCRPRLLW